MLRIPLVRYLWKRAMLHRVEFKDSVERLEYLYALEDPWDMATAREQHRFEKTNEFLLTQVPQIKSLLEIGCGEGHQTAVFNRVAEQVFGLDVSKSAITRAQLACPDAAYAIGDITTTKIPEDWPKFEVVAACEVIYYMRDIPKALDAMEAAGSAVLVTYYDHYRAMLDPIILSRPGVVQQRIAYQDTNWTAAFWRSAPPAMPG